MIFGMTPFTLFHVVLSLLGIVAGFAVVGGLLKSDRANGWTLVFLVATAATVVTGFLSPFNGFTPAIGTGIVTTFVLIVAFAGRYRFDMQGRWRTVYVIAAVTSFYLNFFVLVVQAFLKVPQLNALAPNGNEPPFAIAQGIVLVAFAAAGYRAVKEFRPAA